MRKLSLTTFVVLVATQASFVAASDDLFAKLDRNQDGELTSDEIDASRRRLYDRLLRTSDQDKNGTLSAAEFQSGLKPQTAEKPLVKKQSSQMPGANALLLILAKMDANSDGQIEKVEVPRQYVAFYSRIEDRLGGESDGVLDQREIRQAAPRMSRFAIRLAQQQNIDVDLELALLSERQWQAAQRMTGSRSRGELLADPNRARQFFKQLDADSDGLVSLEEVPEQVVSRFEMLLDRADRNGDDLLSEQELMTVSRYMQSRAEAVKQPRTKQQAQAIERMLKRLDRDGDRRVSRQEAPRRMAGRFDRLDRDGSGYLERKEIANLVAATGAMRRPESRPAMRSEMKMESEADRRN